MKLFISGQCDGFNNKKKLTPVNAKVKDFLDKSKDGELFETWQLSMILNINRSLISSVGCYGVLDKYSFKFLANTKRYWGKPCTINQLRRDANDDGKRRHKIAKE